MNPRGLEQQIKSLARTLIVGLAVMALAVGYWAIIRAPTLIVRDDNPRRIEAERRIRRGNILDRQGQPLALSEPERMGVWRRVYPLPAAAPVVGYYSLNQGTGGIERAYDTILRGDRAMSSLEQLQADLLHLPTGGVSVTLTLDAGAQQAAFQALEGWSGAVVLLEVRSGDILALISRPTFNPNTLGQDWPTLQTSPSRPMLNRATQGLYAPGLIMQTVTLAAALQEGLAAPDSVFSDTTGILLSVEPPVACPAPPARARFTLTDAFLMPCNVLFARLGLDLGGDRLADYATRLGIGRPLGLPLDAATGQLLQGGAWNRLLTARTAIGQGQVLVTPLEMALMAATIANDGMRPSPRLVTRIGDAAQPPTDSRPAISTTVARDIQTILIRAWEQGRPDEATANMGGRAGSADSGRPGAPPHAWFIGFAPAIQPRYAIAVLVEHGNDGWQVAAPIARQVFDQVLK